MGSYNEYIDYRKVENRKQGFYKSLYTRILMNDFDSYCIKFIVENNNYNNKEKIWYSIFYGFSKNPYFSMIVTNIVRKLKIINEYKLYNIFNNYINDMTLSDRLIYLIKKRNNEYFYKDFTDKLISLIMIFNKKISFLEKNLNGDYKLIYRLFKSIPNMRKNSNFELFMYSCHIIYNLNKNEYLNINYDLYGRKGIIYISSLDRDIKFNYIDNYTIKICNIELVKLYEEFILKFYKTCNIFDFKNHIVLYKDLFQGFNVGNIRRYNKFTPNYYSSISLINLYKCIKLFTDIDWKPYVASLDKRNLIGLRNSSYNLNYFYIARDYGMIPGLHYYFKDEIDVYKYLNLEYPENLEKLKY